MTIQKFLLRVVFGSLALAACFGAVAMIFAGYDTLWRIVGTSVATAVGAFLLFGSSSVADREATRLPGALATRAARSDGVAYVCTGATCDAPVDSPRALLSRLQLDVVG